MYAIDAPVREIKMKKNQSTIIASSSKEDERFSTRYFLPPVIKTVYIEKT